MKKSLIILLSALTLLACACKSKKSVDPNQLNGEITISGAFALYPMALLWADEFMKQHPGVTITVSGGGAGKGMTDALSDMVDLGMFSRSVSQVETERGAYPVAVVRDAVVATINPENPHYANIIRKGLKKEDFVKIFVNGAYTHWNQLDKGPKADKLHVYTRSDACGAAETFAAYLGGHQENLLGTGINGDPGMAAAVQKDPLGIGYNNIGFAYNMQTRKPNPGLQIIPIDINENGKIDPEENFYDSLDNITAAIRSGIYPAPPARDLYFISNGAPKREVVKAFLEYVLTDGQKLVEEGGYVGLDQKQIESELQRLK